MFPFPSTTPVMARGQERFNIYCSPCHGRTGHGDGMVVRRGYRRPPSYHDDRLRNAPVGHFFDVITNGFGAMPDYAAQIKVGGPLGDRRLHPRAAAERARDGRRRAGRPSAETHRSERPLDADRRRTRSRSSRRYQRRLLIAGAAGAAGLARRRGSSTPTQFFQSYLMAYMLCLGVTLGCLALGMMHQLSGGAWGVVIRRPIGAARACCR